MGATPLIFCILLLVSAFFSGSETAIFSFSESEIESISHTPFGKKIKRLRTNPSKLLNTILLSNLIVNIANATIVTTAFYDHFGNKGIAYAIIFETTIILIFGEVLPKTMAARFHKRFAHISVLVLPFLKVIFTPVLALFEFITRPFIRLFIKIIPATEEHLKKKEVIGILKKGETSTLDPVEETILINMLNIQLFSVKNIMNNVNHDLFVKKDTTVEELKDHFVESKSPFIILYEDDYENITGIIKSKYLFAEDLEAMVEEPYFIPEQIKIRDIIHMLRKRTLGLVVDEYGTITGTITYDDIMDYILQSVSEESDDTSHLVMTDNSIIVDSTTPVTRINRILGINLDDDEAKTIGGYVENIHGDIPRKGTVLDTRESKILVIDADKKRINKLKIIKKGDE